MADPEKDRRVREFMEPPLDPPPDVPTRDLTVDGPHGPVPVRVYGDADGSGRPALLWMHGGAFMFGDLDMPEADRTGARGLRPGRRRRRQRRLPARRRRRAPPGAARRRRGRGPLAARLRGRARRRPRPDHDRRRQRRRQPGHRGGAAAARRGRLAAGRADPGLPGAARPAAGAVGRAGGAAGRGPADARRSPRRRPPGSTPTTSAVRSTSPTATRSPRSPTWPACARPCWSPPSTTTCAPPARPSPSCSRRPASECASGWPTACCTASSTSRPSLEPVDAVLDLMSDTVSTSTTLVPLEN